MQRGVVPASAFMVLFALLAGACSSPKRTPVRPRVVAAFYPIAHAAGRIGGGDFAVTDLTPPGAEPHDLELRSSDVRAIRDADLVFYLGGGFQPSIDDAIAALPDKSKAIDLLAGIGPVQLREEGKVDPHVWLSPPLMQRIAAAIADALARKLPAKSDAIRAHAAAFGQELAALDETGETLLAHCARREFFTTHAAFGYLADRYGLKQVGIEGLSPEAEPSSKRLQKVARLAKASGATTIFFETLVSPRVAQAVARIAGAKTALLDPIESIDPGAAARGENYYTAMRANISALAEALGCT